VTKLQDRLALHTWTVDTTPLADALSAARNGGFNAIELRRIDFTRCQDRGMTNDQVLALVKTSGVKVACVGTEYGVIFARGAERDRLLGALDLTCRNAVALGCDLVMIAPGQNPPGTLAEAAENYRLAGGVAKPYGIRLALEFNSQHKVINSLKAARELFALTRHPNCGILLDAYHMERCGDGGPSFRDMPLSEIFAFQYSDVPAGKPADASRPTDRLAPGQGVVRWKEVFSLLKEKGYPGYLSYEAPNPAHWSKPAVEVAREGAAATRALLAQIE